LEDFWSNIEKEDSDLFLSSLNTILSDSKKIKVVVLTYYWPPSGGPAVQRWLTFTNQFHDYDIIPYVITVDENYATYPMVDNSLVHEVNPFTKVIKTVTKEFFWIYKKYLGKGTVPSAGFVNEHKPGPKKQLARFIRGNFFIPDGRKSWNKILIPTAIELIKREGIQIIISAGPPHSTHLAAMKIKEAFPSIVWIADFHDAWTDVWYYKKLLHTKLAKKIDARLEHKVLLKADKVLTVGQFLLNKLKDKLENQKDNKFNLISMGYDADLFQEIPNTQLVPKKVFNIVYTGTINSEYEPWILFDAIKEISNLYPEVKIMLKFYGKVEEGLMNYTREHNLDNNVEFGPYITHKQVIEELYKSDALFLCSPKTESEDIIIPGKIYEYMASGKPIINIGSKVSNTAFIIDECKAGSNFDRSQLEQLILFIKELIEKTPRIFFGDEDSIKRYSRQEETKILVKMINESLMNTN